MNVNEGAIGDQVSVFTGGRDFVQDEDLVDSATVRSEAPLQVTQGRYSFRPRTDANVNDLFKYLCHHGSSVAIVR